LNFFISFKSFFGRNNFIVALAKTNTSWINDNFSANVFFNKYGVC
jgi:hypothetical protein